MPTTLGGVSIAVYQLIDGLQQKIQKIDFKVYLTEINMSSAFDIINREDLAQIIKTNFDEDVYRITKILLSNTTLGIKFRYTKTSSFVNNKSLKQGDGISGILFNVYLEGSPRRATVTKVSLT